MDGLKRVDERSEMFAKRVIDQDEEMRAGFSDKFAEMAQVADYLFPRRDFDLTPQPNDTRTRRLFDVQGMISHERLSATIFGMMLSPDQPWSQPLTLNRDPRTYEEEAWFDHVSKRMHTWYSASSNTFRVCMAEDVLDNTAFSVSIHWQAPGPRGPVYISVPLKQCVWNRSEEGEYDLLSRKYTMRLSNALRRWPDSQKLKKLAEGQANPHMLNVTIIHLVERRPWGRPGAVRLEKPWRDVSVLVDDAEVLEVGGHERFKYNIGQFQGRAGDPTGGLGPGFRSLPLVKVCSTMVEAWMRAGQKAADPVKGTYLPSSAVLDRRPGALNRINQLMAMQMRNPEQLIFDIENGGDTRLTPQMLQYFHAQIEQIFMMDWIRPSGDGPQKTAAEVHDNRNMRLGMMGPIVARMEHEKLNTNVSMTFEDLQAIDYFLPPPDSLVNEEIGFEFKGPLSLAQRSAEADGLMRFLEAGMAVAQADPNTALLFEGEKMMRTFQRAYGVSPLHLASPQVYEERRQAQAERQDMEAEAAATKDAAIAMRDGAQGLASLANSGAAA